MVLAHACRRAGDSFSDPRQHRHVGARALTGRTDRKTHDAELSSRTKCRATPARGPRAERGRIREVRPRGRHGGDVSGLADELTRWFGLFGYHALLSRALAEAKRSHQALDDIRIRSATDPCLERLPESVERYGTDAVTEGIIAMLMALIDLLSRLIGEDMALKLLDQPVPLRGPQADTPEDGSAS